MMFGVGIICRSRLQIGIFAGLLIILIIFRMLKSTWLLVLMAMRFVVLWDSM